MPCVYAHISFHNDGSVSPPIPLLNIQTAITRMTDSGQVRGQVKSSASTML